MTDLNERYLARLAFWLRAGGADGARAISILSDVRAHLGDSGESPYEAFGPPRLYAKEFRAGSSWSWSRRAAGGVALVALVTACFSAADDVAYLHSQRPLWWSAPQWVVVATTVVLLLLGWQALLYFTGRPIASLAGDSVDAQRAWKLRGARRRYVSIGLLVVVVVASGIWGVQLGHAYVESSKLRVTPYVYSATGTVANSSDSGVSVRTVIYLDARGPWTSLNEAALSSGQDPSALEASSLQGFGSLAEALRVAHNHNWSLSQDEVPGFTLHYGSYYVLTWSGALYSGLVNQAPATQEYLVLTYDVEGVGLKTLQIPLSVNSND